MPSPTKATPRAPGSAEVRNEMQDRSLMTVERAAFELDCCTRTVRRLIKAKKLKAIRFNRELRVHRSDFNAFIATLPRA